MPTLAYRVSMAAHVGLGRTASYIKPVIMGGLTNGRAPPSEQ